MSWLRWGLLRGFPILFFATLLGLPLVLITPARDFREVTALDPSETGGARSIINKLKPSQFPLNQTSHVSVSAAETRRALKIDSRLLSRWEVSGCHF